MSVGTGARSTGAGRFSGLSTRVTTAPGERDEVEVEHPAMGRPLGTVPRCTAEDVELAVTRGRAAQEAWARISHSARAAVLMRLGDVRSGMSLFADETFGPVAAVSTFADEEEAVARANEGCFGLNFSVWTRDTARGRRLAARLQAGTVNVNEGYAAAWGSIDAPMGGIKDSGLGRRHGATGILKYTEPQTVSVQRLIPIAPPPLVGQLLRARLMTLGLRVLSRIPGVR